MKTVNYFEVVLSTYHDSVVARIRFTADGAIHESALYSIPEINNIITLWSMGELLGGFAIGYNLASDYSFQMVEI